MDGECSPGDDPQASERPLRRRRTEFLKLRRLRHTGKIAGQNSGRTGHAKDGTLNTKVGRPRASWLSAVGPRFGLVRPSEEDASFVSRCSASRAILNVYVQAYSVQIRPPP
jgi:hypothetical protein